MDRGKEDAEAPEVEFENTEPEEEGIVLDETVRRVEFDPSHRRIKDLFNDYKGRDLDPRPGFQRGYVWDRVRASKLIESVLLQVPIPLIYTAEEEDGREVVIDGQQRLMTFFSYIDGVFPDGVKPFKLTGLQILKDLNNKSFSELGADARRDFERYTIPVIKISRRSNPDVKFEIFYRLNTGSVVLSEQELRNCVFRGRFNDLLRELASTAEFQRAIGINGAARRMADVEMVLRFIAFYDKTYLNYAGRMKQFLNQEMVDRRDISKERGDEFGSAFKKAADLSFTVFGERSFRRFVRGDDRDSNGRWERPLNKALYDVVMWGFTRYEKRQIVECKDSVREELLHLLTSDDEFVDAITTTTADPRRVKTRFEKWSKSLEGIVTVPRREQRSFTLELKESLFASNRTCAICSQRIEELDDSEVDHLDEYWRGGRTVPENARLAHRFCNRSRKRKG